MLGRWLYDLIGSSNKRPRRRAAGHLESLEARQLLANDPIVTVATNFGNFQIQLLPGVAPATVANFLTYVDDGAYNDAIFHRSVPGFVEQTGGFLSPSNTYSGSTSQFTPIVTNSPIALEYSLPNTLGTVAMARGSAANSATSQWFVNMADNTQQLGPGNGGGYAVFGKVINNGLVVLANVQKLPVNSLDSTFTQVPLGANNTLVRISSATVDSIDGTVFTDVNVNGQFDAGELGLAGRTVFIDNDASGVPDANNPSTTTDANGNYTFSGLSPGSYTVREVLPANANLTTPIQTATVSADHTAIANFGERPSIEGTVFVDANSNGQFDSGELGAGGRTVFLNIDGTGAPDANNPSTTTDANGNYFFSNLAPGSYSVAEILPSGVTLTTASTRTAVVQSGQTVLAVNFGEKPPPVSDNQQFVMQVYHDLLRRDAEPQALQYWPNLLATGQTRGQVALEIEESPEYRNDTVDGLFQLYLHRDAEPTALSAASNLLAAGGTPEQLSIGLISSPEYFQTRAGGTNQGFLNALFSDALHRPPDAATANFLYNLDFSQQSVRLQIAGAVFGSNEYLSDLVSYPSALNNIPSGYVAFAWYEAFLDRDAESAAVASAISSLHAGVSDQLLIAGILGSDEYLARAKNAT
jgi:cyclophilin family peptidyl-prolyl cis-trans isomerase